MADEIEKKEEKPNQIFKPEDILALVNNVIRQTGSDRKRAIDLVEKLTEQDFYVYMLIDPRNNQPFYIGKGRRDRMYQHIEEAKKSSKNTHKLNKIRKILFEGYDDIIYQKIINNISETIAYEIEKTIIKYYGRLDLGTGILCNHTDGGDGIINLSEEARKKLNFRYAWILKYGEEEVIKKWNEYTIKRIESLKNSEKARASYNKPGRFDHFIKYNTNKIVSDETKEKQRQSHLNSKKQQLAWEKSKGKTISEEQKEILRKPKSEEHKKKLSIAAKNRNSIPENNPMFGKHHSEEAKKKISQKNKGKIAWNNGLTKNGK